MANKWLRHLAQFRRNNREIPPTKMMQAARSSYQQNGGAPLPGAKPPLPPKLMKGGVVPYEHQGTESSYAKVGGRRTRRQSRRSRRTRRR